MEFYVEKGEDKRVLLALLGIPLFFYLGLQNSIYFYDSLPKKIPDRGFVVFYQPGCPHCVAEIPTIKELVALGYKVAAFNVYEYPELVSRFGVTATPTIVVVPYGQKIVGEATLDELIAAYRGEGVSDGGEACGITQDSCSAT